MLDTVERNHVAFLSDLDGRDLTVEPARVLSRRCTPLTFRCKGILIRAAYAMFGRHIFGRHAHMAGPERTVQRAQHHIHRAGVTHLLTPAYRGHSIGSAAHVLGSTRQSELRIAKHQGLDHRDECLGSGPAEPVDVHRGRGLWDARLHYRDAGQVHVPWFGIYHMAEGDRPDLIALDTGAIQRCFGDCGAERDRRYRGATAAESADGRACAIQNDDVLIHAHGVLPSPLCFAVG